MGMFGKKSVMLAQQTGACMEITKAPDPVFADKVLGDGVCIEPTDGVVRAPISGKVVQIAHTGHAIAIESDDGLEVLVHLGIDTVKLEGEGFTAAVKEGDHVNAGDKLMDMDIALIKERGFSTVSPCIITNMDAVKNVKFVTGDVVAGETEVISYKKV